MAFDLCVIPVSTVPYLSALQTRQFSVKDITAHLVSGKLTRDQCRLMTPENFASSYGSSSYALYVRRSSVSSEINLAITSSASSSDNAPTGYTIVVQGYLNEQNSQIVLGVCVSDEPIVADASLRLFVNIEETNNVFRLSADFDGMVTQGLLDDLLERYVTTDTKQTITSTKTLRSGEFRTNLNISDIAVEHVPSSTSDHVSTATLASDGIHADGVSFKNDYGRAADNYLVASVSGNSGYSELTSLGGRGFKFCYKGADETEYHYPLRLEAGTTMFDENQTLHLAKDTNTYLHVNDDTLSVKDYVERIAGSSVSDDDYSKIFAGVWDYNTVESNTPTLSGSPLSSDSDNVLVVLSKSSSKLVPLLVPGPCAGDVMVNTQFDWESPIYALFEGFRCFSAHPMVDFSQILGSHSGVNDPVFISDYDETFHETNKRFCVGIPYDVNIPSSCIHWRLLGYTTSTPGYIRLTESHPFLKDFIYQTGGYVKLSDFTDIFYDASYGSVNPSQYVDYLRTDYGYALSVAVRELVSNHGDTVFHLNDLDPSSVYASESNGEVYVRLPSMTTVEFEDRMSFRTSAGEAAYIDSDGVYHGRVLEADTSVNATYATELNVSDGVSTVASFKYGSGTWETDNGINPTSPDTLSLGSVSYPWRDIYGYTLHAWGDSASSGLRLCDGDFESSAYSSITGYQSGSNGQMKFHHYNASDGIDYVVTSTGPNITDTSTEEATLTTVPQTTGTWTVGSSDYKLAAVYANTFYGDLSGNATTATRATRATQDDSGNTITSTYGSSLRTYTRATNNSSSSPYGSTSNRYIELCSNSGSSLGKVYLSDVIANALRGCGGFGWGSAAGSSTAGYRTYGSYGSVGSLGLFTTYLTASGSAGAQIAGTYLHPVRFCDYNQTSSPSSGAATPLNAVDIRAVHHGATMSGTWYVLNGYGGFSTPYAWFVIAVRIL